MYDTIIVGADPTGSYVAGELAARGHEVLVFEQHEKVGKATCCTGIVGEECLDVFPIGKEAVLREARSARFITPSGESFRLEKQTTQAYIIDRPAFDSNVAQRAQEAGAEYLMNTHVKDITLERDFVRLNVETEGQKASFKGKTVVIASGFGSNLPQSLGFGESSDFVMGAQVEVETDIDEEVELYFGNNIAPGFFGWFVPSSQGRALVGLLSRHHTGSYLKSFLVRLANQEKIATPDVELKYGGIPLRPLHKTARERVIVVGDAAGQVKPTTGGGIYYGLLSAQIAADTLHEALTSNDFGAEMFKQYEKNWRRKLSRELKIGYWARRYFEKLDDQQIERLFHIVWSRGIHESLLESAGFSFDWHGRLIINGVRRLGLRSAVSLLWPLLSSRLARKP
ncbi:geranylgeranyl reductase family protein [Chloroflexota bacterium]